MNLIQMIQCLESVAMYPLAYTFLTLLCIRRYRYNSIAFILIKICINVVVSYSIFGALTHSFYVRMYVYLCLYVYGAHHHQHKNNVLKSIFMACIPVPTSKFTVRYCFKVCPLRNHWRSTESDASAAAAVATTAAAPSCSSALTNNHPNRL